MVNSGWIVMVGPSSWWIAVRGRGMVGGRLMERLGSCVGCSAAGISGTVVDCGVVVVGKGFISHNWFSLQIIFTPSN